MIGLPFTQRLKSSTSPEIVITQRQRFWSMKSSSEGRPHQYFHLQKPYTWLNKGILWVTWSELLPSCRVVSFLSLSSLLRGEIDLAGQCEVCQKAKEGVRVQSASPRLAPLLICLCPGDLSYKASVCSTMDVLGINWSWVNWLGLLAVREQRETLCG